MGDAVNMAARLMAACTTTVIPNGDPSILSLSPRATGLSKWRPLLLVDKPTAEAASLSVQCTPLGSIRVKGKSAPIEIFHPTKFHDHKNGIVKEQFKQRMGDYGDLGRLGLVGEVAKANVAAVERAVAKLCQSGHDGAAGPTVMMITGEQGFGKHSVAASLVDICPKYNIVIACATPSTATHNMYEDGLLELEADFTAFRGPLLSMASTLYNSGRLPKYRNPLQRLMTPSPNYSKVKSFLIKKFYSGDNKQLLGTDLSLDQSGRQSRASDQSLDQELSGNVGRKSLLNNRRDSVSGGGSGASVAEDLNIFRVARAILPGYLHRDIPLLSLIFPECTDDQEDNMHLSFEEVDPEERVPLFREHVEERIEELHSRLNRDEHFHVTIAGQMDGEHPTSFLGHGNEPQEWADAGLAHAFTAFSKFLDDSLLELYDHFPNQVKFGSVATEAATSSHYQVFAANAQNWSLTEGSEIVGASQEGIVAQKEGVFGIITTPVHGAPVRDIDTQRKNKSRRSRLIKLVVAIITRCFEMADKQCGDSAPFRFLIVIEHAHIAMGYRAWEIVNALMKIGEQRRAASTVKQLKRMSTAEATATSFASASRPLICMVSRPLKRFAATPEYFELMEITAKHDTLIQIHEMTESDTALMLRRCLAKRLWRLKSNEPSGYFEIVRDLKKVRPTFTQFEESLTIDPLVLDFTWDCTHGCPFEIKAVSENLAQTDMVSVELEFDEEGVCGIYASVAAGKSLDTMPLSHVLKSSVISRFHAILDEKPYIWSHIVRLASCFQSRFSPSMLSHLLRTMKNNEGESCNLDFSESFIIHMMQGLSDCGILEKVETLTSRAASVSSRDWDVYYDFRSKLVRHALRETLLQSQLDVNIGEEFQQHCEPILKMHRLSHG
jgi:hypothetical protein